MASTLALGNGLQRNLKGRAAFLLACRQLHHVRKIAIYDNKEIQEARLGNIALDSKHDMRISNVSRNMTRMTYENFQLLHVWRLNSAGIVCNQSLAIASCVSHVPNM